MSLQTCTDTSEAVALDAALGLYLKPASKIKISVQLPKLKIPGQSISSWQVMEKLRAAIRPDLFLTLKALKITAAVIKFQGELETRSAADRALARLQTTGGIKLVGFSDFLQIRTAHAASLGPTRHDWDSFFRDARGVDEMKPGERPDTVHLQDLPTSWFSESSKNVKPSERLLHKAFSTFGRIRRLEIPSVSNEDQTFGKTSSMYQNLTFQVYIQYEEYVEFATAMDSLRGKKLVHKDSSDGKMYSAEIKVDFDRMNYLSDRNIKKRALEAKKLKNVASPNPDISSTKKEPAVNNKVAKVESIEHKTPDLIDIAEAKKEATFLLKELLQRSEKSEREKDKKNKERAEKLALLAAAAKREEEIRQKEKRNQEKLIEQERILKEKLLRNLKVKEHEKIVHSREKLRKKLAGRKLLSVLGTAKSKHKNVKSFR